MYQLCLRQGSWAIYAHSQFGHRFEDRGETAEFDADTFMAFYKGKNEYRSHAQPENSGSTTEPMSRHDWLMLTGYTTTQPKPWKLPDLGYTQTRTATENETQEMEQAARE